jgi:predicted acetyltransferase
VPPDLRLRPVRISDEDVVLAAQSAMAEDGFVFALGLEEGMPFEAYAELLERHRHGLDLPPGFVPGTFLLAEVDGQVVGRTSVRHELNDFLLREGGHIGYGVLPPYRRRGFATEILRQSLVVARAVGVDRVLVTCDDDNAGSVAVIEANGGRLDPDLPLVAGPGGATPKRRYWIP